MRHVVVRVDGGEGIGSGHLARCLALSEALVSRRVAVSVLSRQLPEEWDARYRAAGVETAGAVRRSADWGVVDGYHIPAEERTVLRRTTPRLLLVDDHGLSPAGDVDIVVDQNLGASADNYRARLPEAQLLLGTQYAMLRRQFREWSGPRAVPGHARVLLLALGGSPPARLRDLARDLARHSLLSGLAVRWLEGMDDVAAALAGADVVVSAAGTTSWELCRVGAPALVFAAADNQRPLAAALGTVGAAEDLGWWEDLDVEAVARRVAALATDAPRRRAMAAVGPRLVDGQGAIRVATAMQAQAITLRAAASGDARRLWEWANDRAVRDAAFNPDPIPWPDHLRWFEGRLRDPAARIWLAETGGSALGQVRFEGGGPEVEIDVSVDPSRRGGGWGAALVRAATDRLLRERPEAVAVARIRPENVISQRAFSDAGYRDEGEGSDGRHAWVRYARRRDDDGTWR